MKHPETLRSKLDDLRRSGWQIAYLSRPEPLPEVIVQRYRWVPAEVLEVIQSLSEAHSPDDKAWLLAVSEFSGSSSLAFAWNEWERQSLDAAEGSQQLEAEITHFWDTHFPIMMSVKSGYAYFALEAATLKVVVGEEPEYEEPSVLADSLAEALDLVVKRDPTVERWV
jgi:hypothetical protein